MRKRDFTFRQLSSFVAAARSGSFALAADQLGISQPAVSDHISTLERHLGHALFERRRGTTPRLTHEGIHMLEHAETLLQTSHAIHGGSGRQPHSGKVHVRISIGQRHTALFLKPMLPRLYAEHPNIEIEIKPVIPMRDVASAMARGDFDLLFYTVGHIPHELAHVRPIQDVPIQLVAAPSLASKVRGATTLADLPFIFPNNGMVSENWLERQLADAGVRPRRPIRYLEYADVVQAMAEQGVGAAILMTEQIADALAAGTLVDLGVTLPPMKRIIARAPSTPHAVELIEQDLVRALLGRTA